MNFLLRVEQVIAELLIFEGELQKLFEQKIEFSQHFAHPAFVGRGLVFDFAARLFQFLKARAQRGAKSRQSFRLDFFAVRFNFGVVFGRQTLFKPLGIGHEDEIRGLGDQAREQKRDRPGRSERRRQSHDRSHAQNVGVFAQGREVTVFHRR